MPRESVVQIIARKKAIYIEQFEIEKEKSAIAPEHLWVINKNATADSFDLTSEEAEIKAQSLTLDMRMSNTKVALHRANLFGRLHTKGLIPTLCLTCFVDHNKSSLMVEVESDRGNGIRQFECPACKQILYVNPL